MGLFDRLFGKKKDTKEQIEEQEIARPTLERLFSMRSNSRC